MGAAASSVTVLLQLAGTCAGAAVCVRRQPFKRLHANTQRAGQAFLLSGFALNVAGALVLLHRFYAAAAGLPFSPLFALGEAALLSATTLALPTLLTRVRSDSSLRRFERHSVVTHAVLVPLLTAVLLLRYLLTAPLAVLAVELFLFGESVLFSAIFISLLAKLLCGSDKFERLASGEAAVPATLTGEELDGSDSRLCDSEVRSEISADIEEYCIARARMASAQMSEVSEVSPDTSLSLSARYSREAASAFITLVAAVIAFCSASLSHYLALIQFLSLNPAASSLSGDASAIFSIISYIGILYVLIAILFKTPAQMGVQKLVQDRKQRFFAERLKNFIVDVGRTGLMGDDLLDEDTSVSGCTSLEITESGAVGVANTQAMAEIASLPKELSEDCASTPCEEVIRTDEKICPAEAASPDNEMSNSFKEPAKQPEDSPDETNESSNANSQLSRRISKAADEEEDAVLNDLKQRTKTLNEELAVEECISKRLKSAHSSANQSEATARSTPVATPINPLIGNAVIHQAAVLSQENIADNHYMEDLKILDPFSSSEDNDTAVEETVFGESTGSKR